MRTCYGWLMGCLVAIAPLSNQRALAAPQTVECDILVIGGGLAGVATAYEGLRYGKTVCLTEITDWLGGQLSAQGTSALDEQLRQRQQWWFPAGYSQLRRRIIAQNRPGDCWVSEVCFLPAVGATLVSDLLQEMAAQGRGTLKVFLNTVVQEITPADDPQQPGQLIRHVRGIQHRRAPQAPPLNTDPLSQTLADIYSDQDSPRLSKTILNFQPPTAGDWMVIEATETGEVLALADLPYRLGIDPVSVDNPSASSPVPYPYCPQAITYTFALEVMAEPQTYRRPASYDRFAPFYSYAHLRFGQEPVLVLTYRRIFSAQPAQGSRQVSVGDISMQNWERGNDYGPGTAMDNLLLTRSQLLASGQLQPRRWQGGWRIAGLAAAEELARNYFYWLATGTTDAVLGDNIKQPNPYLRYLQGYDSPMGTAHGLSKFPYIREGRRLVGRYQGGWPAGFSIDEIDISAKPYWQDPYYPQTLGAEQFQQLAIRMGGLQGLAVARGVLPLSQMQWRRRARLYPDSIGIGYYPIDFHPCMLQHPPEAAGNIERPRERQGAGQTYPFQVPLRALIPPRINNLLVTGKNIATSHIAAAAYRVHPYEWSVGAGTGTVAAYVLEQGLRPHQLTEPLPLYSPHLVQVQRRLQAAANPIAFPDNF
ncbi:FAD-dependent oxidoreductase [Synechococcus sp. PCC 6717]|jgi:hypothetical protein|nr:FAD-dependent oxidoreductase [Synechococcus sp. PCC 6717]